MKTKILYAILALTLFAVYSCSDDDDQGPGTLELNFYATYGSQPLIMNEVYPLIGNREIRINVSEFYLSDLTLVSTNGNQGLQYPTVDFVDFTSNNGTTTDARIPQTLVFEGLESGEYSSLTYGIGVNKETNASSPSDYENGHVLARDQNYWGGWTSYIFDKLEGKFATTDGGETDLIFTYHSGKDELYKKVTLPAFFEIKEGQTTTIDVNIDHILLFATDGGVIDIEAKPTAHNPDDLEYPIIIMSNFQNATNLR